MNPNYHGPQLFMVTHPQRHLGLSYLVHRPYLDASGQPSQHRPIHPQQISFPIQPQPPPQTQPQPQPPKQERVQSALPSLEPLPQLKTKDQIKAKIGDIKEKCITHYVGGQLIIETSSSMTEKKFKKSSKTKKKKMKKKKKMHPEPQPQIQKPQYQLQLQYQPQVPPIAQPIEQPIKQQQLQYQPQTQALPEVGYSERRKQQQQPTPIQTTPANQVSNEIQQIRADMPKWSVAEVVDFIEKHEDIRQYSSKFAEDEVDGKALLLMIDRNLNFQILTLMFKHGPAMKIEATLSKYKINEGR